MSRSERFIYSKEAVEREEKRRERECERYATRMSSLAETFKRIKKAEIVGLLMKLANATPDVAAWFEVQLNISKSKTDQIFDIERDIEIASSVPKHLINYNFPVDYEAYERIEHALQKLIEAGHLDSAMELAKQLMRAGSNEVEMSDEGLMADTIADCLRLVARAVKSAEISDEQRFAVDFCDGECRPSWIYLGDNIAKTLARVRNRAIRESECFSRHPSSTSNTPILLTLAFRCGRRINANPTSYEICIASELAMRWICVGNSSPGRTRS